MTREELDEAITDFIWGATDHDSEYLKQEYETMTEEQFLQKYGLAIIVNEQRKEKWKEQ